MTPTFICKCCGKSARVRVQPLLIPGRAPLIQVECIQTGCANKDWTYTYCEGGDNAQVFTRYTPQPETGLPGTDAAPV